MTRLIVETAEEPCPNTHDSPTVDVVVPSDPPRTYVVRRGEAHSPACICGGSGSVLKPWVVTPQDAMQVPDNQPMCEADSRSTCTWPECKCTSLPVTPEPGSTYRDVELVMPCPNQEDEPCDFWAEDTQGIHRRFIHHTCDGTGHRPLGVVATVYVIEKANVKQSRMPSSVLPQPMEQGRAVQLGTTSTERDLWVPADWFADLFAAVQAIPGDVVCIATGLERT